MKVPEVAPLTFWFLATQVLLKLTADAAITFIEEPKNKEAHPNVFIMMKCRVSSLPPNHHLVWAHNDDPILQDSELINENIELRYRGNGHQNESNLVIQPVKAEDHGSYFSCRVYDGSLLSGGTAHLVMESRSAMLTVVYAPPAKFPQCRVAANEKNKMVHVVLSCCTQIVSVPLSLSWMAQGENSSWRITKLASTGYETGQNCVDVDIGNGLNFSLYQCNLDDASDKLEDLETRHCKVTKLGPIRISTKFLDHKNVQFNCTVPMMSNYKYMFMWHLQDQEKTQMKQMSRLSTESTLDLQLSEVSNVSSLYCSVFDGYNMGTTDLQIVLKGQPPSDGNPTVVIIGVVIGAVVGVLIFGLSTYFLLIKWRRRNERLYASLERGSETGLQVGPGSAYIYHKNGVHGSIHSEAEGGTLEMDPEEIPPKPGGHRTISWEPEDIIIRSNGGVINNTEDPTRRNVEGLVYADLALDKEQDAEIQQQAAQEEAMKGAIGGDMDVSKVVSNGRDSIEYASIVPPPRSLRF